MLQRQTGSKSTTHSRRDQPGPNTPRRWQQRVLHLCGCPLRSHSDELAREHSSVFQPAMSLLSPRTSMDSTASRELVYFILPNRRTIERHWRTVQLPPRSSERREAMARNSPKRKIREPAHQDPVVHFRSSDDRDLAIATTTVGTFVRLYFQCAGPTPKVRVGGCHGLGVNRSDGIDNVQNI